MKPMGRHILFLTARGVAIVYALVLLVFAFDVFGGGQPLGTAVVEFVIHAAPSLLVGFVLSISWKRAQLAGILLLACAVVFTLFFHAHIAWSSFFLLTMPLLVSGALFIIQARWKGSAA
jgi:hypothetical protein